MDAERIAELRTWSQKGCANSFVIIELLVEIERLQAIIDKNAKTTDLLDRTLDALTRHFNLPLDAAEAAEGG